MQQGLLGLSILIFQIFINISILSGSDIQKEEVPCSFREIWGYVFKGEEKWINDEQSITDIAYFNAPINDTGKISTIPNPSLISKKVSSKVRIHCVISCPYNRSLMYWCLKKDLETRKALVNDIVHIADSFDGIQIDLECIRPEDGDAFLSFLREIKKGLPKEKILSVTLPARVKVTKDAYHYKNIAQIADRVLIMAYDEHYRTSSPGTVASLNWCKRICTFAKEMIEPDKLIMGIGLYGRVWQKQKVPSSLKYFQTLDLWKKHTPLVKRHVDGSPFFEYQQTVDAAVHYEDLQSLKNKLCYYEDSNVHGIGFWRISQEPAALWKHVQTVR